MNSHADLLISNKASGLPQRNGAVPSVGVPRKDVHSQVSWGERLYELGRGSTCCKDVVGGGWQDAVIWTQDLVFEVGIIMPAGLPCKVLLSLP